MSSSLLLLAESALASTQQLVDHLRNGAVNEKATKAKLDRTTGDFLTASSKLSTALYGPTNTLLSLVASQWDLAALNFFLEFKIVDHIDPETGTHLNVLSEKIGVDSRRVGRLIRLLVTRDILDESEDDIFRLTPQSKALREDSDITAALSMLIDEVFQATVHTADYLKANPFPTDSNDDSIFKYKWGKPMYNYFSENVVKGARFAAGQEGMSKMEKSDELLLDWAKALRAETGKIVDVGGGRGHIVIELAEHLPKYEFVVQDLYTSMFESSAASLPAGLRSRITFEQHDFFQPQPLVAPGSTPVIAYIIRRCLHNWPDADAVRVIRSFVPALRSDGNCALLINESVLPRLGEIPQHEDHLLRQFDIAMMVLLNARQRTEGDWRGLVKEAHENLEVVSVTKAEYGGTMGLIEVRFRK